MDNIFGEVLYAYSRKQAIEDGILVDMTEYKPENENIPMLKQAGFKYPMAFTRTAYFEAVSLPDNYTGIQSIAGRFWDVLMCLYFAIKKGTSGSEIVFSVSVRQIESGGDDADESKVIRLKCVLGPGDTPEPVFTVMLSNED